MRRKVLRKKLDAINQRGLNHGHRIQLHLHNRHIVRKANDPGNLHSLVHPFKFGGNFGVRVYEDKLINPSQYQGSLGINLGRVACFKAIFEELAGGVGIKQLLDDAIISDDGETVICSINTIERELKALNDFPGRKATFALAWAKILQTDLTHYLKCIG